MERAAMTVAFSLVTGASFAQSIRLMLALSDFNEPYSAS